MVRFWKNVEVGEDGKKEFKDLVRVAIGRMNEMWCSDSLPIGAVLHFLESCWPLSGNSNSNYSLTIKIV
jgi:hypothetical protein